MSRFGGRDARQRDRLGAVDADEELPTPEWITIDELRNDARWQEEMDRASERAATLTRRVKQLQARHWETWIAVKRAVDGADPEAFLAMGCPNDEYDDAVAYLAERMVRNNSVSEDGLAAWFRGFYGAEPDSDAVRQLLDSLDGIRQILRSLDGLNCPDL